MCKLATNLIAHRLSETMHISSHFTLFCASSSFLEFSFFCNEFFCQYECASSKYSCQLWNFMLIGFKPPIFIRDPLLCSFQGTTCNFSYKLVEVFLCRLLRRIFFELWSGDLLEGSVLWPGICGTQVKSSGNKIRMNPSRSLDGAYFSETPMSWHVRPPCSLKAIMNY